MVKTTGIFKSVLEKLCTILIFQLAELVSVKSLVSVLCGLVLGRDVRGGLASLDGAKCTLRGGFLGAIGTGALAAIFAILIVS